MMFSNNPICEKTKLYYYDYLTRQGVELIPAEIAEHLEQCEFCKSQIVLLSKQLKQVDAGKNAENNSAVLTNLKLHFAYTDKLVDCKIVRPFLPGLVDETLTVRIPTPITVHLDNCEKCQTEFERIKSLGLGQKKLFKLAQEFAEKPELDESGVVTRYKIKGETGVDSLLADTNSPYDQWPIKVEISMKSQEAFGPALRKEKRRLDLRPFVKPILAAAAMILVVFFVMHSNIAKAVDLEQIYNAIKQVRNICLTSFALESDEPIQKIWVSRDLNVKVCETNSSLVLWNLDKRIQKSYSLISSSIEIKPLDEDAVLKVSETMSKSLGLLPFESMPDVLNKDVDAKWQQVSQKDSDIKIANTEIYDLVWLENSVKGNIIYNRWRCFVEPDTKLPRRVEHWQKQSKNDEYKPITIINVIYPTDNEIGLVIQNAGF